MENDRDDRHGHEHAERCGGRCRRLRLLSVKVPLQRPREAGRGEAQPDDAERPVRWSAVPFQVVRRTGRHGDDVDVRGVGREEERGGRPSSGAPEPRPRQREREETMSEIVHACFWLLVAGYWLLVTGCWLLVAG